MKVLVALDESTVSLHAARAAVRLFGPLHPEFLVINVARLPVAWIDPAGFGSVGPLPPLEWEQLAGPSPSELIERAEEGGMGDAKVLTESGDPATCICRAAEQHDADVLVVGSHDRGVLSRLLDPSVAAGVVRGTHRPVLVVSSDDHGEPRGV